MFPDTVRMPERFARRMWEARYAHRPLSVVVVDQMAIHYGFLLQDVPDEAWMPPDFNPARGRIPQKERREILQRIAAGATARDCAVEFGVSPDTIRRWAKPPRKAEAGYCACGCGRKTSVAEVTSRRDGTVKGKPLRYIRGHNPKKAAA